MTAPTIAQIKDLVCAEMGISLTEMNGHVRSRQIVAPRHTAIWLARRMTGKSLPEIGRAFGRRDHTTIKHALDRVELRLADDESYAHQVYGLVARLEAAPIAEARSYQVLPISDPLFQVNVNVWMTACFGDAISLDPMERSHRFLEEALELAQANGCTAHEAHQLVDYVFGRPVGALEQEIGGVMVTLASLCTAIGADMALAGEIELARVWKAIDRIRAKQAAKPAHSPLPGSVEVAA